MKPIDKTTQSGDTQPDSSVLHKNSLPNIHMPYLKAVYKILEIQSDAAVCMHVQYAPY